MGLFGEILSSASQGEIVASSQFRMESDQQIRASSSKILLNKWRLGVVTQDLRPETLTVSPSADAEGFPHVIYIFMLVMGKRGGGTGKERLDGRETGRIKVI